MAREIKFRVWNSHREEFEEDYARHPITAQKLDWLTVEQFTGFKDTQGTEVYEGDILSYEFSMPDSKIFPNQEPDQLSGFVSFREGLYRCGWMALNEFSENNTLIGKTKRETYGRSGPGTLNVWNNFKVVGNIHQNPELIFP